MDHINPIALDAVSHDEIRFHGLGTRNVAGCLRLDEAKVLLTRSQNIRLQFVDVRHDRATETPQPRDEGPIRERVRVDNPETAMRHLANHATDVRVVQRRPQAEPPRDAHRRARQPPGRRLRMPHWRKRGELCREFTTLAKHHLEVDARVCSKPTQELK